MCTNINIYIYTFNETSLLAYIRSPLIALELSVIILRYFDSATMILKSIFRHVRKVARKVGH